jgi:hypothetical protein
VTATRFLRVLPLLLLALLPACENDFSPKAEYEERVVLFSVLDPNAPYQVVRLERTFDADNSNPATAPTPDPITDAEVTVTARNRRHVFRDTLFTLPDGSKKKVWINNEIVPTEGVDYTMTVEVPGFKPISAVTRVPSRAYTQLQVVAGGVRLAAVPQTAYPPSGFYFRLWVVGSKNVDGRQVEFRREVPIRGSAETGYDFPEPSRDRSVTFSNAQLLRVHSELRNEEGVSGSDIVGVGYSLDQYLYTFYKLARGFDDPVSVRQDRPDISNVQGGAGIYGAMFSDSVKVRFSAVVQQ